MIQTVLCSSLIGPEDDVWGDTLHDVKSLLLVERARDGQATPETLTRFLGFRIVHVIMTDKQQEPVSYRRCILNSVFSFDSILLFTMFYRVISNIWLKIKNWMLVGKMHSSNFFVLLARIMLCFCWRLLKNVLNLSVCHIFFPFLNKAFFLQSGYRLRV